MFRGELKNGKLHFREDVTLKSYIFLKTVTRPKFLITFFSNSYQKNIFVALQISLLLRKNMYGASFIKNNLIEIRKKIRLQL